MGNPNAKAEKRLSRPAGRSTSEELNDKAGHPDISEVKDIVDQAGYRDDSLLRQTLRGDETRGDADARDVAGATDFDDMPHGREETKNDKAGAPNQNG
ncbi:MAG: hypothetical protein ABI857_09650 [Acidobacteriota bacterium]